MSQLSQLNGMRRVCIQDANANNSSVNFQDTDLAFTVDPGFQYTFDATILFRLQGTTSGYKFQLVDADALSVGLVISAGLRVYNGATGALAQAKADQNAPVSIGGALPSAGLHLMKMDGIIFAGSAQGTLKLQFAQNVADAVNSIRIMQRSFMSMDMMN